MDYTKLIELMTKFPHSTRWCDIVSIGNWMKLGYSFEEAFTSTPINESFLTKKNVQRGNSILVLYTFLINLSRKIWFICKYVNDEQMLY